jgi:hypothetical protein
MTPKDEWVQAVPGRTDEQYDEAMKARAATPMAVAPTPPAKPASPVVRPVPATFPIPNDVQIEALKANSKMAADFDKKFGPGASLRYGK